MGITNNVVSFGHREVGPDVHPGRDNNSPGRVQQGNPNCAGLAHGAPHDVRTKNQLSGRSSAGTPRTQATMHKTRVREPNRADVFRKNTKPTETTLYFKCLTSFWGGGDDFYHECNTSVESFYHEYPNLIMNTFNLITSSTEILVPKQTYRVQQVRNILSVDSLTHSTHPPGRWLCVRNAMTVFY